MKIAWITYGKIQRQHGQWGSELASARYRILIPAAELAKQGYEIQVLSNQNPEDQAALQNIRADAVIVSKSFHPSNEESARRAKQAGAKLIFDICDNHFESAEFGGHYRAMAQLADTITVNTSVMAEIAQQHTGRGSLVVDDPYEGVQGRPRFAPAPDLLKLLWFGHPVNFDSLNPMLQQLLPLSQQRRLHLRLISAPVGGIEQSCQQFSRQFPRFQLSFSPWSVATTWQALQQTDLVVISTVATAQKSVKSANRLIEALWAGRFTVAQPVPSYQPFADWAWVNWDIAQGIQWALQHPGEVAQRIQAAQDHIADHFSPLAVARQWQAALRSG